MENSSAPTSALPSPEGEISAQEKARLRRERRAAKIQAGGASRLQAIAGLQGGTHRDVAKDVPVKPSPTASPAVSGTATPDPDEIDISQHHYTPTSQPRLPPSSQSPFAFDGTSTAPFPPNQGQDTPQDPMAAMMQQMMGGGGFPGGRPDQLPEGLPPGLANLFSAMQGGEQEPSPEQSSAWIWRLVHSVFSVFLSFYIVFQTPFNGSKFARTNPTSMQDGWTLDASPSDTFKNFFYLFATFEVALQSSRYFIEKGRLQGGGMLTTVAQLLPEPYAGYVRVVGRYSVIYKTVVSDAMVVVFVLGAASWWRGGVPA